MGLKFSHHAQFNPILYLAGLSEVSIRRGARFFENSRVRDIQVHSSTKVEVKTQAGFTVTAHSVVVSTDTPINDRFVMHTKQSGYRSYAIAYRTQGSPTDELLLWDNEDPYHYVRKQDGYLIVGGEDHKTGQADQADPFKSLDRWARDHFSFIEEAAFQWSGQVWETIDGYAFIGRNPADTPNVYLITGQSGLGMTHSTLGSRVITDLIQGKKNPYTDLYNPSRVSLHGWVTFVSENANTFAQYADWLQPGEVKSESEIKPDSGAILRQGLYKVAVYRDTDNKIHACSAICPHLGGIVAWNDIEKSWDCPCHASRFNAYGQVIEGPAISDLKPASLANPLKDR